MLSSKPKVSIAITSAPVNCRNSSYLSETHNTVLAPESLIMNCFLASGAVGSMATYAWPLFRIPRIEK